MELEQAFETIKKANLPNADELIGAFNDRLHKTNSEAKGLRDRLGAVEGEANSFKTKHEKVVAALKERGIDPDSDMGQQFEKLLSGSKPASEVDQLVKQMKKMEQNQESLQKKLDETDAARLAAINEGIITKALEQFHDPITKAFGKNGATVKELMTLKKMVAVKDGVPGLMIDDEFIPLNVNKGKIGAVDKLKILYPELAITNQTSGGKDVKVSLPPGVTENELKTYEEWKTLPMQEQHEYMLKVKRFAA